MSTKIFLAIPILFLLFGCGEKNSTVPSSGKTTIWRWSRRSKPIAPSRATSSTGFAATAGRLSLWLLELSLSNAKMVEAGQGKGKPRGFPGRSILLFLVKDLDLKLVDGRALDVEDVEEEVFVFYLIPLLGEAVAQKLDQEPADGVVFGVD